MINAQLLILRPDHNEICPKYFYYSFCDADFQFQIRNFVSGSAQPQLPIHSLRNLVYRYPPLQTQRKIASILSAYDDLIENNTRRIAILEEMAQAIYRDWFVNFRFPGHENVRLVDSPVGKIPEGWEPTTWGELATLEYGKRLLDYKDAEGPVPVYGTNGPIGFNDIALCDRAGVIIGRKGAYRGVEYSDVPFWVIDTAFYLNPTCDSVDIIWAYYKLLQLDINKMDSGSAIPSTSRDAFYAVPVVLPADNVVTELRDIVDDLMLKCRVLHRKNHNLRTTRDLLLPKLISGQLDVEDLDIDAQKSFNDEPQA